MTGETDALEATAAEYGLALGAHVGSIKRGQDDPDLSRSLVSRMVAAPVRTLADLLALVAWAEAMASSAFAVLPEDETPFGGPRAMTGCAAALLARARQSLEAETGIAPEVFTGSPDISN